MRRGVVELAEGSLTTRNLFPTTGERVTTHQEGLSEGVIRGAGAAEREEEEEEGEVRGGTLGLMTGLVGWQGNTCTGRFLFCIAHCPS